MSRSVKQDYDVSRAREVERIPVGTPVRYWPGFREGDGVESATRSPVWLICGSPVVAVDGYAGGIALTHVERIAP